MKKVIILGGAGFIGLNIAKYLIAKKNYKITIADNLSRGKMDSYLEEIISYENVDFIEGDFTKKSSLKVSIPIMIIVTCLHQLWESIIHLRFLVR